MDKKLQKEENIIQEDDNPVNGSLQPPECVVCSTTSPESSFIYTSRTKLGTSLFDFVQTFIKPSWKPEEHPKYIIICKSCYDAVNKLERVQMKFLIHGFESTDSDSDGEGTNRDVGKKYYPAEDDNILFQNLETSEEKPKGGTLDCNICNRIYFPFSYGRDLINEDRFDAPLNCLVCQKLFIPRPSKHRKPVTDRKPFGCMLCRCRFSKEIFLKGHLKYHTSQTPYQCHACKLKFDKRPKLLEHLKECKLCACGINCFQVKGKFTGGSWKWTTN